MKLPEIPSNETERLRALREYSILDSLPEREFDDITRLASQICDTPISLVTIIDTNRQWFKSNRGLSVSETPRDFAFCAHAINAPDEIMTVNDSRVDERFSDNPLVTGEPHVIFYAGVPLVNPEGLALGTICVIDNKPRELDSFQRESLKALSHQVVKLFELKRSNQLLEESRQELEKRNSDLKQFAYVVSHDIKSPLNNILMLTDFLKHQYASQMDADGIDSLNYLRSSSVQLKNLVDGILSYYAGDRILEHPMTEFDVNAVIHDVIELLNPKREHSIEFSTEPFLVTSSEAALKQMFVNLISNGIKYNHKNRVSIVIIVAHDENSYRFTVRDNGDGIPQSSIEKIFDPFVTLGTTDRFNNTGTGIGLSTVKKLVDKLGGSISVQSEPGAGSEFTVSLPRQPAA